MSTRREEKKNSAVRGFPISHYLCIIAAFAGVTAVHAQQAAGDAPPPTQLAEAPVDATTTLEKIIVTGSNIRRAESETAENVQIISSQEILRSGQPTVADYLHTITGIGAWPNVTDYVAFATAVGPNFGEQDFCGASDGYKHKDGGYRIKVQINEGKKTKTKVVPETDDLCSFTPNVVVAFP